jgi:predicted double-glycine peptidase
MKKIFPFVSAAFVFALFPGCNGGGGGTSTERVYIMEKNGRNITLFEDRDILKILEVPKTRQAHEWTCGPNAVQKICAYYGEDHREADLAAMLGSSSLHGTNLQPIIDFFRKENFKVDVRENMTVADLKSYIDRGIPVIMMIQAWVEHPSEYQGWENGHFTVCIGYTRDEILFADPSLYDIGYIPADKLLHRWHDEDLGGKRYHRLGIAVYGKKPNFDLEKIEEIK